MRVKAGWLAGMALVMAAAACSGDAEPEAANVDADADAAYCDLLEQSVELQVNAGADGPSPEQEAEMIALAQQLRDEAPADIAEAYEVIDDLKPTASGDERIDAMRAYSERVNDWMNTHCEGA